MNKQIKFSGLGRNLPQDSSPDGSCQEIINMRYKKGAWRPIPAKEVIHNANFTYLGSPISFDRIYLHDIEGGINDGLPNWIGYSKAFGAIFLINPVTNVCTVIDYAQSDNTINVTVVFLKRTMIVTTSSGLQVYLYSTTDGGKYGRVGSLPTPYVDFTVTKTLDPAIHTQYDSNGQKGIYGTAQTERAHTPEAVLGNYYALVNQQSANYGRLYGSIMYMVAYRLFDGSYVMHSLPRYLEISNGGWLHTNNPDGSGWDNAQWGMILTFGKLTGLLVSGNYPAITYDNMKDIVDSIVVFATPCTPLFKIDDTTVIESMLQSTAKPEYLQTDITRNFTDCFPLNSPDFEKLAESKGWYQIMEFDFAEVVGHTGGTISKDAETKGFYQDYATRKALPTDNFSHHGLIAKTALVYNDYLHILSVKTKYETPTLHVEEFSGYALDMNRDGVVVAYLSTGMGKAVLVNECKVPVYLKVSDGQYYYCQYGVVGYPDSRCTKIEVAVKDNNGIYRLLYSVALSKNESMNYAYYHDKTYSLTGSNYAHKWTHENSLGAVYSIPLGAETKFDQNRLQVSEIQNPLVFPAKNSYQIGTGEGIAMASASEPLSSGQFGQHPLMVFTTKGRYVLQIGSGEVLYSNILPVDGEVANNAMNVIGTGKGIIYSTEKGLYIASGMETQRISESVEGFPVTEIRNEEELQSMLTDLRCVPDLAGTLSTVDFLTYLKGSSIGYDQVNKEIIVTNPNFLHSYLYSTENGIWYSISGSYSLLMPFYPALYGIRGGVVQNLSSEQVTNTSCMIITNAMSLEMPEIRKKIERMIARCEMDTASGSYVGLYLFATDDLMTHQFITGRQRTGDVLKDLILQRSHGSARYYTLVFCGLISHDSSLSYVDTMLIDRASGKIR